VSLGKLRKIQHSCYDPTGNEPRLFADLTNSTRIYHVIKGVSEESRLTQQITNMAESTAISIKTFDGTDYKSRSLEIDILMDQKRVLGSVNG
jgi:hypothetical protein